MYEMDDVNTPQSLRVLNPSRDRDFLLMCRRQHLPLTSSLRIASALNTFLVQLRPEKDCCGDLDDEEQGQDTLVKK